MPSLLKGALLSVAASVAASSPLDLEGLIESLSRLYEASAKGPPRPLMEVDGRVLVGPPLDASSFHPLKPRFSRRRFLYVDASLKVLFDCGGFKAVEVKAAAVIWRREEPAKRLPPRKRLTLAARRREAEEELLRAELEEAWEGLKLLEEGDYCVLDRPLVTARRLGGLLDDFAEACRRMGVWLMGVCKSSRLRLSSGEPLMGYLNYLSSRAMPGGGWFYHPLFQLEGAGLSFIGTPVAVKFSGESPYVFRVDVERTALSEERLATCLSDLAGLQDTATPGLPYPVVGVHEEAKLSRHEVELDRARLLEALKDRGLLERFLASARSMNFKEEELWGGLL
jgi:hypothetical protein